MSCDRKIGPFDCCSVVEGDCLELMKQIGDEDGNVWDCSGIEPKLAKLAIITDPPYGLGISAQLFTGARKRMDRSDWDNERIADLSELQRLGAIQVIWGGNYYDVSPSRGWLVWRKPDAPPSMAQCELAWTNLDQNTRFIEHSIAATNAERVNHPTQKPLRVMLWTIQETALDADLILDPFCGSGTTLVAAKKLGRHFLGFEISPEYCEIARDRLARIDAQPTLFAPKPEQMTLGGAE